MTNTFYNAANELVERAFKIFKDFIPSLMKKIDEDDVMLFVGYYKYPFTYSYHDRSSHVSVHIDIREFLFLGRGTSGININKNFLLRLYLLYLVMCFEKSDLRVFKAENSLALEKSFKKLFLEMTGYKIRDKYGRYDFIDYGGVHGGKTYSTMFIDSLEEQLGSYLYAAAILFDGSTQKPDFLHKVNRQRLINLRQARTENMRQNDENNTRGTSTSEKVKVGFCSVTNKPYGISIDTFAILEMEGKRLQSPYDPNGYIVF